MSPYIRSLGYALEGIWHALSTERNLKLFTFLFLVSVGFSWFFGITASQWEMVIFTGGFFLAVEMMNTALEHFADAFDTHTKSQNDAHTKAIKATKDIAAGASLLCAIAWGIVLLFIFVPHLWRWMEM